MSRKEFHTQTLDAPLEFAGTKNPDVAAFDFVVRIAELPADPLREVARHTDSEQAAGLEHPLNLAEKAGVVWNVFQHF